MIVKVLSQIADSAFADEMQKIGAVKQSYGLGERLQMSNQGTTDSLKQHVKVMKERVGRTVSLIKNKEQK